MLMSKARFNDDYFLPQRRFYYQDQQTAMPFAGKCAGSNITISPLALLHLSFICIGTYLYFTIKGNFLLVNNPNFAVPINNRNSVI